MEHLKGITAFIINLLILTLAFQSVSSCSSTNCSKVLNQEPRMVRMDTNISDHDIEYDFEILRQCGGLEEQDEFFLRKEIIGSIMIQLISNQQALTYGNIIAQIILLKESDSCEAIKDVYNSENQLKNILVSQSSFKTIVPILIKGGFPEDELDMFESFLIEENLEGESYEKALLLWKTEKVKRQYRNFESINFAFLENMDSVLRRAHDNDKPSFIFFTGYSCQNCQKFENNILSESRVSQLLNQDFVCYIAYVDDKKKIDGTNDSRGMIQEKIQQEYFHSNSQPSIFILNPKGEIKCELNEMQSAEEFLRKLVNCKN